MVDGVELRRLPKVSLHDHLDGGLRPQTIVEIADDIGLALPASDGESLGQWFVDAADSGSLPEYLKTFDITTGVMQTEESLARIAKEFVLDLAADGVVYGEIRWAPEQHLQRGLTLDATVEAVQEGIEQGVSIIESQGGTLRVGQLVSAMRHLDRWTEIAELAIRHRDKGVVGFDIAGPEEGFPASRHSEAFDLLARSYLPVTVHAGEGAGIGSIRDALFSSRTLRLGHGARIAEDIEIDSDDAEAIFVRLGDTAEWVRSRQIALELSVSSNLQTGTITQWGDDIEDHPFDLLYQLGFRVTVNTDNRLQSGTSLTRELSLLSDAFGYGLDDIEQFQVNAAQSAFLPVEERDELVDLISDRFDGFR